MSRGGGTHNPYTPDSGARPPALTGRELELEHLKSIVSQLTAGGTEKHVLITGLRGVGKTVLLNEFEEMCAEASWPAEAREVGRNSSVATLLGHAARRAMRQMSAQKRAGERLRQALRVLKAFEVTLPSEFSFSSMWTPPLARRTPAILSRTCAMCSARSAMPPLRPVSVLRSYSTRCRTWVETTTRR